MRCRLLFCFVLLVSIAVGLAPSGVGRPSVSLASASSAAPPDWNALIDALQSENWSKAAQLAPQMLKKFDNELTDSEKARLRYMHIYAVAGLLAYHKLTKEQALAAVKDYQGAEIQPPGHRLSQSEECLFGCWTPQSAGSDTLTACEASASNSRIHCFLEVVRPSSLVLADNWNKIVYIQGRLAKLEAEGHMMPRFRITINQAMANVE